MGGEDWIVAVESGSVTLVDLKKSGAITKRPIQADAALMNPTSPILALRSAQTLQIFNLSEKKKVGEHTLSSPLVHWRWVDGNTLALVTSSSVYHWEALSPKPSSPKKIFERHASLPPAMQILQYEVTGDGKWCLIGGIIAGEGGAINGAMQLYSTEKNVSQPLSGHAAAFTTLTNLPGRSDPASVLVFHQQTPGVSEQKLYVMEVGRDPALGPAFKLQPTVIPVPQDAGRDFMVSLTIDTPNSIAYLISKMGYVYLFDLHTGKALYRARISQETIFSTVSTENGAIIGLTARKGQLLSISLNKATIVGYIQATLRDTPLAMSLAGRLSLPGAEHLYEAELERLLASGQVAEAAKVVAKSGGSLRTPATIQRFQAIPAQPGQPQPVFVYFSALLEEVQLNEAESLELARPVIAQNRPQLLERWLKEEKLTSSEALGDILMAVDVGLALSVYLRAKIHAKAVQCFAQRGEFAKIPAYVKQVEYTMDFQALLNQLVFSNPVGGLEFAKALATPAEGPPLIDLQAAAESFLSANRIQEATSFLLEALKDNLPEHAYLQTKLLEINLIGGAPQVADAILANKIFDKFDRAHVAKMCERAGLWQRAAENFDEIADIKRVFKNAHAMEPTFIVGFFANLSADDAILLLKDLMSRGGAHVQVVVEICKTYHAELGADALIGVFETFKATEGLYYFLAAIVNFSENPQVHFKYIQAAAQLGQFKECERVCRDSTIYDPVVVKEYLKGAKLVDPRPLIHVCDRHDFVEELAEYLYSNGLIQYVEIYVTKVSPAKTPQVVGKLLELDANEDLIKKILMSVGGACPVDEMVEIAETRNRLRLLQSWLENRVATGSTEPATHNGLGKIYLSQNIEPRQFLENNMFYEPAVLGKFCEGLDPSLAFAAYQKANGDCDDQLIRITASHSLYRELARYCVSRMDAGLWEKVLKREEDGTESVECRSLIDQVVEWALPESSNADEVSATVKAFLAAELPGELINLLERIVLQGSEFSENSNLQNLLILTAIRAEPTKVAEYIDRLDHFDGPAIAKIAASEEHELFEEAFSIYVKFSKSDFNDDKDQMEELQLSAIGILVDNLKELDRAKTFAERVNLSPVWSKLGNAQLDEQLASEAIASFLSAQDPAEYLKVCEAANEAELWSDLIPYLEMARESIKENGLDSELIWALSKTGEMAQLETFVNGPNCANIQHVGDRLFSEGLFTPAKLLFASNNNNAKLALCHINLAEFRDAVTAAGKANSVATWKAVCWACIAAQEFKLAGSCGLKIIVHPDHLDELVGVYETAGHYEELLQLMENGLGLEGAHSGIFTEMGILFSRHNPKRLMDHLKTFISKMNVTKTIKACERARLWTEAVFCYQKDGQPDAAVKTMMEHSISFDHELFLTLIVSVRNSDLLYKAVSFYLSYEPMLLEKLLASVMESIDHTRCVRLLRNAGDHALFLAKPYLKAAQPVNNSAVNQAINSLYLEDEDYECLRDSIDAFDNFDQIALAVEVESHELLEFRRIAAYLYRKNKRYVQSISLSKDDKMFKDAIDTAAESGKGEVVEELLTYFCKFSEKECFCACLYTCFDLVSPDVAIELGWRNGYVDYIMPFVVQWVKNASVDMADIKKKLEAPKETDEMAAGYGMGVNGFGNGLMLTNGPAVGFEAQNGHGGVMPPVGVGGMPMGVTGIVNGGMSMGMPGMQQY
ncbi:hypothetical protein TL16_g10645, partial [Triparma laevis f. inornata]